MPHELSLHARMALAERQIAVEWMERAIDNPAKIELSRDDPGKESRFVRIPEYGDRVLRVVVNKRFAPERTVTVYFDRTMKGCL